MADHVSWILPVSDHVVYCGISTDCSAVVTRDGFEQMGGVFEIGVTV